MSELEKLLNFLQNESCRIEFGDMWFIADVDGSYYVYRRKSYQKITRCLYEGKSLSDAIDTMIRNA